MLRAKDVMTSQVVSVASDSTVSTVADLLVKHGISAVPVIDNGRLVGIVSEGDLVHRAEIGTEPRHRRSWWLNIFGDKASLAAEYTRSHSARVADVMMRNVVTVAETTPLSEVADLLEKKRIKRAPVMRFGAVVGIVSRADLVRALATAKRPPLAAASDDSIRARLLEALTAEPWLQAEGPQVTVSDGVVAFWGVLRSEEERQAMRVLAENIEGVRRVEDHMAMIEFPVVAI